MPSDLLQKAWDKGNVRVIVELGGVGAVPEGQLLSQAAVTSQRGRIGSDQATLRSALRGLHHRVLREFKTVPYVGLEVDYDTLRVLDSLPGLATRVHEDMLLRPMLAQSAPLIKAPDAWNAGWDGSGQVIVIVDTGVDKHHAFLAGKVIEEACYSAEGSCPNGNTSQTGSGAGVPCTYAPSGCRHGTHVAGIAAGTGSTFSGVARGAKIMAIQVFSRFTGEFCANQEEDPCTLSWSSDQVAALERVYQLRATHEFASANLSLGSGTTYSAACNSQNPAMTAVIANLRSAGIATVVASGNGGDVDGISSPACISSAISVGATSDGSGGLASDLVMDFSNSASFLSLLAPGYQINSSVPGGGFAAFAGTSMAAPHVAGAWAIARQAFPTASVDDVLAGFRNTGKLVLDPGNHLTFARIATTLLQFSTSAYSVRETAGSATITVTRTGATFGPNFAPLTVDYATSAGTAHPDQDYTETSGILQFNAGETSKSFTVSILNNLTNDGPRTVNLALTEFGGGALPGARDTAVLTIINDDTPGTIQFSASAYNVSEAAEAAIVTVTRSGGTMGDIRVQYATSDGTAHDGQDYQAASGTITFDSSGPGATTKTFTVPIIGNDTIDGNRAVNLTLHSPTGGASLGSQKTAVLTIVDDEIALQFSQASYSVTKGGGATITVTRTGSPEPAVGVTYTVLPGSATQGVDYGGPFSGMLSFGANQTSRTFTIPTVNDTQVESPETVLLQLSTPTNGALLGPRQTAVLTIVDNNTGGAFKLGATAFSASEAASLVNVTVTRSGGSAGSGKVRIRTVSDGGSAVPDVDYVPLEQVLDFAAGQMSRTVAIPLLTGANLTVEGARTIKVALDQPWPLGLASVASPSQATVTIGDNDVGGTIQFTPTSLSVLETAGNLVLTVTRTGGAAMGVGATWKITSAGNAVHGIDFDGPLTGTVSFDTGPSQSITIPLIDRPGAHGTRTLQVKLTAPTVGAKLGASLATASILDEMVGFRFDPANYAVSEGSASATVTVRRTGPSQGQASVRVATVDPPDSGAGTAIAVTDYMPSTKVLTFLPGQTALTFTVPLKNDTAIDGSRTINLALSAPSTGELGQPHAATVTIGDNDLAGTFRFTAATYTATERTAIVNITVVRSGGAGGSIDVPWSVAGGTATPGDDPPAAGVDVVLPASGVLQFGPSVTSRTIPVTIVNDGESEPNETVILELGTPTLSGAATPAGALGTPKTATLIVVDNDRKGTIQFAAPLVSVAEADATVQLTLTRTGNVNDPATATVEWVLTGGKATADTSPGPGVDVVVPTVTTVEFTQGQTTKTIPLTTFHDAVAEGSLPETLVFTLQNPGVGWALGPVPSTTLSLVEGTVQFSGLPYVVSEATGSKTVTVTRSGLTTQPVTVNYTAGPPGSAHGAASPNTCLPGDDYRPVTGTLIFSPGQTSKTFSVPLCGDSMVEGDEELTLTLAVMSGPAIIGPSGDTATLTITENDLAGAIQFSSSTYSASEGQGSATVTVTRTGTGLGAKVHWAVIGGTATAGVDYLLNPLEGDIDFANLTSKAIVIPLVNTTAADGPRTILIELSNPLPAGLASLGANAQATLTINDDEPTLRLNSTLYTVSETDANTSFNVTILRAGATTAPVSATLVPQQTSAATGGTCGVGEADFATSPIPVNLAAGQASKTVQVPICADTRAEGSESFGLQLQSPVGATLANPSTASVSLTDNETAGTLRWTAADASGIEGTTLVLTVTRTGGTASDVTVEVTAHDGDDDTPGADAVAGVDYEVSHPVPPQLRPERAQPDRRDRAPAQGRRSGAARLPRDAPRREQPGGPRKPVDRHRLDPRPAGLRVRRAPP